MFSIILTVWMINILVTGSKGQLGSSILSLKNNFSDYNFLFTDINELDLVNFSEVENYVVNNKIQVIINCAAYTKVDKAEDEVRIAEEINNLAVENLARLAKKFKMKLIHISTNYWSEEKLEKPYTKQINQIRKVFMG